jgi:hypothetical protein
VELLLNLAWLLIAVVCAMGLLRRAKREPDATHVWLLITAVLCIVVLLFPVISMTDDLHAPLFTAEDNGKRRSISVHIQQQSLSLQAVSALVTTMLMLLPRITWSRTEATTVPAEPTNFSIFCLKRPPPCAHFA